MAAVVTAAGSSVHRAGYAWGRAVARYFRWAVPVGAATRRAVRLPRWDGLLIPLPGAHVAFVLGQPIHLPSDSRPPAGLPARAAFVRKMMLDLGLSFAVDV